jgi:proteasome lid subunit RPN8/RPN11
MFAPLAWLKLQFFCHAGDTEVGGFGRSAAGRPLYVEEFVTVPQDVTPVSVSLRDDAVAELFDRSVDSGLPPDRFARIWLHTHPGASPAPSGVDEATFGRAFGACDWAVLFILGRTGRTYARLMFAAGPGGARPLRCAVDWSCWPGQLTGDDLGDRVNAWRHEYARNIHPGPRPAALLGGSADQRGSAACWSLPAFQSAPFDAWEGGPLDDGDRF